MSSGSRVILITGISASGKTTLGRELAKRLNIPFISRDDIKETLFDSLGWEDREWSKKLGRGAFDLLFYFIELLLKANVSFMVESNFRPESTPTFLALKEKYHFDIVQILCKADGNVLFERFKKRAESGERHPGHVDTVNIESFKESLLSGHWEPLKIEGKIIEVDTTDFEKVDVEGIANELKID